MEVYRFDDEVSLPVSEFGSRFRLARLIDQQSRAAASVLHLPPGGVVGRHPAAARQLLAVVAGSGWASGADGRRRSLPVGRAALFEAGELHDAGSENGLTALCVEGVFEVQAVLITGDIVVVDHDPSWSEWFEELRSFVWPAVSGVALRVDHVGSTSVPGLAAKPVIDADVVVASEADVSKAIEALALIGYRWKGDYGVVGRQAFSAPADVPLPRHHLYVVVEGNKAHVDHWLFRDLLREDPAARERYTQLKRENVDLADRDMEVYVARKAAFVAEVLREGRAARGLPPETYWEPELDPAP